MIGHEERRPAERHMFDPDESDPKVLGVQKIQQGCDLFQEMRVVSVVGRFSRRVCGSVVSRPHRRIDRRQGRSHGVGVSVARAESRAPTGTGARHLVTGGCPNLTSTATKSAGGSAAKSTCCSVMGWSKPRVAACNIIRSEGKPAPP